MCKSLYKIMILLLLAVDFPFHRMKMSVVVDVDCMICLVLRVS